MLVCCNQILSTTMYAVNMPKVIMPMPRVRDSAWFFGTQSKLIGNSYLINEEDILDALERELHDKEIKIQMAPAPTPIGTRNDRETTRVAVGDDAANNSGEEEGEEAIAAEEDPDLDQPLMSSIQDEQQEGVQEEFIDVDELEEMEGIYSDEVIDAGEFEDYEDEQ